MWRVWIILCFCMSACAEFPDVDAALAQGDPEPTVPDLLPFEELLTSDEPRLTETDDDVLLARADALRSRADAIRGPVIDADTKDRMEDGVQQP